MICLLKCGFSTVRLNYRRLNTQFSDRVVMKRQVHWQLRQVEKLLASECQVVLQVSIRSAGTCDKRPIFHDIHIHKHLHMNIDTIYLRSSPSIRLDLQTVYVTHTQADFHIIYIYTHISVCVLCLTDKTKHTSYAAPFARVKGTASASSAGEDLDIFR